MVAHYSPGWAFKITDELSRRVRLSEGMAAEQTLHAAAVKRAIETLRMFRAFCAANGVKRILPVATAAVRDAANQAEFLQRVRAETGLKLSVISGEEEACLGALGAIHATGLRHGLVLDVGGGSAEVSRVRAGRFRRGVTSPLGAVRLTELYLHGERMRASDVRRLADHIASTLQMLDWMKLEKGERFVGLGGTVRALTKIDRELRGYPLGLMNGYELELARLDKLVSRLRELPVSERARKIPALQPDRADIILAGAMVVAEAMRRAGAETLLVSGQGLREGLLYREFFGRAEGHAADDLREFAVLNLARLYGYDTVHADHVAKLALSLFDQLEGLHGYGRWERECLWAAAQLHDIGMVVDYYDHHKHSAYIILGSGLPGYSHREIALIAALCLYHRKGRPALSAAADVFEKGDMERLLRLGACLRLAEYLDRSRAQAVSGLRVEASGNRVKLTVRAHARAEANVEVWEAQRNADLFESAFRRKLEIAL